MSDELTGVCVGGPWHGREMIYQHWKCPPSRGVWPVSMRGMTPDVVEDGGFYEPRRFGWERNGTRREVRLLVHQDADPTLGRTVAMAVLNGEPLPGTPAPIQSRDLPDLPEMPRGADRAEHVEWCKSYAKAVLARAGAKHAVRAITAMVEALSHHPEAKGHPGAELPTVLASIEWESTELFEWSVERWIDGFN